MFGGACGAAATVSAAYYFLMDEYSSMAARLFVKVDELGTLVENVTGSNAKLSVSKSRLEQAERDIEAIRSGGASAADLRDLKLELFKTRDQLVAECLGVSSRLSLLEKENQ